MSHVRLLLDKHTALRIAAVMLSLATIGWAFTNGSGSTPAPVEVIRSLPVAQRGETIPRELFPPVQLPATEDAAPDTRGPPELVGVAGRLPDDMEALVRNLEGRTAALRVGGSAMGWTLVSIAADRVVFEKDGHQLVLTLD